MNSRMNSSICCWRALSAGLAIVLAPSLRSAPHRLLAARAQNGCSGSILEVR